MSLGLAKRPVAARAGRQQRDRCRVAILFAPTNPYQASCMVHLALHPVTLEHSREVQPSFALSPFANYMREHPLRGTMRKIVLDSIMSLDGCYTDGKSQIDWFDFVDEDMTWSHDVLTRAGTLVFGRTTYEDFTGVFPKMDAAKAGFDPYIVERLN